MIESLSSLSQCNKNIKNYCCIPHQDRNSVGVSNGRLPSCVQNKWEYTSLGTETSCRIVCCHILGWVPGYFWANLHQNYPFCLGYSWLSKNLCIPRIGAVGASSCSPRDFRLWGCALHEGCRASVQMPTMPKMMLGIQTGMKYLELGATFQNVHPLLLSIVRPDI